MMRQTRLAWRRATARLRRSAARRGAPDSFETLAAPADAPRLLRMDRIDLVDQPGVRGEIAPVIDVAGRRMFERRYDPAPPESYTALFPTPFALDAPAVILSGAGWVIAQQGWLKPLSYVHGHTFLPPELRLGHPNEIWLRDRMVLTGTTLNAMSDWAASVYGHCLWESVWRVLAYWEAHGDFDGIDHIYAPPLTRKLLGRFDPAILAAAGDRFVHAPGAGTAVVCDNIVALPHPVCGRSVSAGQIALLNRHALLPETDAPRRVLLMREPAAARGIANAREVAETVRRFGYTPITGAGTADIFSLFRQAESVIGVHGSDLADIVFMKAGAHVLELTPTDHIHAYFRTAGALAGLDCQTLFAVSPRHRLRAAGPSDAAVTVDTGVLAATLAARA